MKKPVLLAAIMLFSTSAFSKTILCQVDNLLGNKLPVPVRIIKGSVVSQPEIVSMGDHLFSVLWQQGDSYDPQSSLTMAFDGNFSHMYDVSLEGHVGPINVVDFEGLRFQCWVE